MMSLTVMSLGDRFCISRKGMMEKLGGFTHRVKSMAMSGLRCGKALVGTGWTIILLLYKWA